MSTIVGATIYVPAFIGRGGNNDNTTTVVHTSSTGTSNSLIQLTSSTVTEVESSATASASSSLLIASTHSSSSGNASYFSRSSSVTSTVASSSSSSRSSENASIRVTPAPEWITFDQSNGLLYVTSASNPDNLTVVSPDPSGMKVVKVIPLNSSGGQPIVDSSNGLVYLPAASAVFVINGTRIETMIKNGYAGTTGWGVFDPDNDEVYVATSRMLPSYIAIQVLDTKSNTILANITSPTQLGLGIEALLYSSQGKQIYVSGSSYGVAIINTTTNKVVGSVQIQGNALQVGEGDGIAPDPATNLIYVADFADNQTVIFSSTNDSVVARIAGSGPFNPFYSPNNGLVYVTNALSNSVQILNGTKMVGSVPVGNFPWGLAYDSANSHIYVTNRDSATVSVISSP